MQHCPAIAKDGNYKNFGEVLNKLVLVIGMYNDCSTRHDGLIKYEENR